jgi:AraC family transcriptional regulator
MDGKLIERDELQDWMPGRLTVHNPADGWGGVAVRGYRYGALEVELPAISDYMVVACRRGHTRMGRRVDNAWQQADIDPGDVSLVARGDASHWAWQDDLEVVQVFLEQEQLASVCRAMFEHDVDEVDFEEAIKALDPAIHRTSMLLAHEAAQGDAGNRLMVDALATELAVHILRRHAHVRFREPELAGRLSAAQVREVEDHVHDHLGERIGIDELAAVAGLSRYRFMRAFRASLGTTPYDYVLGRRVELAKALLDGAGLPLHEVARRCGFSDQSHLTREFRKRTGVTPGRFRPGR